MNVRKYDVLLFDSDKNERYLVSMFANCMTTAATKARESIVKSGLVKSENLCIRKIYTVS